MNCILHNFFFLHRPPRPRPNLAAGEEEVWQQRLEAANSYEEFLNNKFDPFDLKMDGEICQGLEETRGSEFVFQINCLSALSK